MALPLDQLPIGEGVHPDGSSGAEFFVDRRMLDALEEYGPAEKHDDGRFVYECVSHPDAIFEGLERDNLADAFCYTVRPTHDPQQPDLETLPRYGLAFLVFVRRGVGGYVVFDWTWREEDGDAPGYPLNWENDFTRRTWPTH